MRAPVLELRTVFRTMARITKFVIVSAAEAELAALFLTTREIVLLHQMLIKMGWSQPKKTCIMVMDMQLNSLQCQKLGQMLQQLG